MSGLFDAEDDERKKREALAPAPKDAPLAERMRPRALDEVLGQGHLLGEGGVLAAILARGLEQSLIFWGPPGVGKTTLARLIAAQSGHRFQPFSAVLSGIADVKRVMQEAEQRRRRSAFPSHAERRVLLLMLLLSGTTPPRLSFPGATAP
jgi:replication-associated recombination protein RarA